MPTPASFDYAILRVVPRVERQEFINAGVVAFCLEQRDLAARIHLNENRLRRDRLSDPLNGHATCGGDSKSR